MSRERFSAERDPANLAVVALVNGVNAFLKKDGLETLVDGVPEHLLVLVASFAETVPAEDPRFVSVLELATASVHHADQQRSLRGDVSDQETRDEYARNLRLLYNAFEDPWEVQGLVAMMRAVNAEDGFEKRAWEKAFRFKAFDQNTPLMTYAEDLPHLPELYERALIDEGVRKPSFAQVDLSLATPDKGTVPPKRPRAPVETSNEPASQPAAGNKNLEWRAGKGRLATSEEERT